MARLSLNSSVKFKRLVRRIGLASPFVRGLLETLWDSAHAKRDPVIGDADDIEIASEWPGEAGAWFTVLRDGAWIEQEGDKWQLHDYWEHAPDYVVKRAAEAAGQKYSEFRNGRIRNTEVPKRFPSPDQTRPDQTTNPLPPDGGVVCDDFEAFWKEYPRKVGRAAAMRAWKRLKPNAEMRSKMLAAVKRHKTSPQWRKQNGDFIPHPTTWLNQGRWDDEVASVNEVSERRKASTAETRIRTTESDEEIAKGREVLLASRKKPAAIVGALASATEVPQ